MENNSNTAFYKTIVESSNEGILLLDGSGFVTFANPKSNEILGYNSKELIGKSLNQLLSKNANFNLKNSFQKGEAIILELAFIHKEGQTVFTRFNGTPIMNNGKLESIIVMLCDITEKRITEDKNQ